MLKYNEFLLEKMINESLVFFSNKFKKILSGIDSPISKQILDIENQDLNVQSNYIDISTDKDYITFIPDRKAKEILSDTNKEKNAKYLGSNGSGVLKHTDSNKNMFDKLDYKYSDGATPYHPSSGMVGDVIRKEKSDETDNVYVHMKFPDGECVINQNKLEYVDSSLDVWVKNRQPIRVGRGLKSLLNVKGIKITDAEMEKFVNQYKSGWDKLHDKFGLFELVKGDDIAYWYKYTRYNEDRGSLSNSCMANAPSSWLEIYTDNDKCSLLILKNESGDKIKGRALVWNLDRPSGQIFMDRIYTNHESDVELFREYAIEQGWYYKVLNGSSSDGTRKSKLDTTSSKMYVIIGRDFGRFPYLDTLKYFNGSELTNEPNGHGYRTLENTDGGSSHDDYCDYCDGSGTVTCGDCDGDGDVTCSTCDGDGVVDCGDCDGEGLIECGNCDGTNAINCGYCEGSGTDDEGDNCGHCDGTGSEECPDCEWGKIKCPECRKGKVECDNCNGSGNETCSGCGGDGYIYCPECG